jgi:hypothetical protein
MRFPENTARAASHLASHEFSLNVNFQKGGKIDNPAKISSNPASGLIEKLTTPANKKMMPNIHAVVCRNSLRILSHNFSCPRGVKMQEKRTFDAL